MSRPWMPFYVGDYLADTRHLSTAEHGAYVLLILHYWQKEGLPTDETRLARIVGMTTDEWAVSRDTLAAFFDEGWKHGRIEFELTQAARISAAGRAGGEASAKARKNKAIERSVNDRSTIGQALQPHTQKEEEQQQSQKSHTPRAVANATRPGGGSSFDEFWEAYPRRGEAANPKKPARDKFDSLVKAGHDPTPIIAAARRYADVERRAGRAGTDKIAQAIKWLEQERWNDYPALTVVAGERSGGVFLRDGCTQWDAWQVYLRATTGKGSPIDKNGGWHFPSEWPPVAAAVVRGH